MRSDMPDGSFIQAGLDRLVREGILDVAEPGTPEHAAARQAIRDEIDVADAEALGIHGPDALTSARLLWQTALVAELDPDRVGHALAAWCRARGWERSDLASRLGVTIDQLAAMALAERTEAGLARRYGADAERLAAVLAG